MEYSLLGFALAVLVSLGVVGYVYMCGVLEMVYSVLGNLTGLVGYGEGLLSNITCGREPRVSWDGYYRYVGFADRFRGLLVNLTYNVSGSVSLSNSSGAGFVGNATGLRLVVNDNGYSTVYVLDRAYSVNGSLVLVFRKQG